MSRYAIFLLSMAIMLLLGTVVSAQEEDSGPGAVGGEDSPVDLTGGGEEEQVQAAAAPALQGPEGELAAVLDRLAADRSLFSRGSEAEKELVRLASAPIELVEAIYDLGVFYLRLGELDEAAARFSQTVAKDPQFAEAIAQLGVIAARRNEGEKARQLMDQALAIDRYCAPARDYLSRQALESGNLDETIRHGRISLLGDPDNLNAYLNMAIALYRKGQYDVGELVGQGALRIDSNNAPILNLLGLINLKRDDVKAAITMFQMAVNADPEFVDARKNLAAVTLNYKDYGAALVQLEQVLAREPDNEEFKLSYAVALRGLERHDEAREQLEKILARSPGNQEARYNLCILLHEFAQQYAEALKVCEQYQASLTRKDEKWQEMNLRVKGIRETMKALEEMKKLQDSAPPPPPTDAGGPGAGEQPGAPASPAAPESAPSPGPEGGENPPPALPEGGENPPPAVPEGGGGAPETGPEGGA